MKYNRNERQKIKLLWRETWSQHGDEYTPSLVLCQLPFSRRHANSGSCRGTPTPTFLAVGGEGQETKDVSKEIKIRLHHLQHTIPPLRSSSITRFCSLSSFFCFSCSARETLTTCKCIVSGMFSGWDGWAIITNPEFSHCGSQGQEINQSRSMPRKICMGHKQDLMLTLEVDADGTLGEDIVRASME